MDFHSLSRRELQGLCKKNKIPANITNLAMADALNALHTVEGLEDVLSTEKSSVDLLAKTEIQQSVTHTSYRTSTRRKPVKEEPLTAQISTRTRGGSRRVPAGKDDQNTAPVDLVTRKMESQLNELAEDEKKGVVTPAAITAVSRRKNGTTSVREAYSTRRTTRLLEKKLMGLNLDDADDEQIVKEDAQAVEELKSNEVAVVTDKEMEVEGISKENKPSDLQEKTEESDEKYVALLEDGHIDVNNESLKIEPQQKPETIDESVDDKNVDAESFDENKGYLEYGLTKLNKEECFTAVKEFEADSFGQFETDHEEEEDKSKEVIPTFVGENKSEDDEDSSSQQLEKILALNEVEIDSMNKDENIAAFETSFEEKSDQPIVVSQVEDAIISFQKCDQISCCSVISESNIVDHSEAEEVGQKENNIETKSPKATEKSHIPWDINKENFVKEKVEKVKIATEAMSIRQLKKMLKELKISDKKNNTGIKEDGGDIIAKNMEKTRPALQPLGDN